jgi:hypothetical protein
VSRSHERGIRPHPWQSPQGASTDHVCGSSASRLHSNLPRPPHPGQGTIGAPRFCSCLRKTHFRILPAISDPSFRPSNSSKLQQQIQIARPATRHGVRRVDARGCRKNGGRGARRRRLERPEISEGQVGERCQTGRRCRALRPASDGRGGGDANVPARQPLPRTAASPNHPSVSEISDIPTRPCPGAAAPGFRQPRVATGRSPRSGRPWPDGSKVARPVRSWATERLTHPEEAAGGVSRGGWPRERPGSARDGSKLDLSTSDDHERKHHGQEPFAEIYPEISAPSKGQDQAGGRGPRRGRPANRHTRG